MCILYIYLQGVIYSDTAAQNYADPELFQKLRDKLPAGRCGTTAEVNCVVVDVLFHWFAL